MIVDGWLVSKIQGTANITAYTTRVYPNYIPLSDNAAINEKVPCIVYTNIGFTRNRSNKNVVFSLTSVNKSKSSVEDLNAQLYTLFDNSTKYIRESSSNIYVESVMIINNAGSIYEQDNRYWTRALDISVWYH